MNKIVLAVVRLTGAENFIFTIAGNETLYTELFACRPLMVVSRAENISGIVGGAGGEGLLPFLQPHTKNIKKTRQVCFTW